MDEIDWMKQFKKFSIFVYIFDVGCVTIFLLSTLINYVINNKIEIIKGFGNIFMIAIGVNTLLILIVLAYIIYRTRYMKIDINFNKEYIREIYKFYPPAIISYIYDLNTEVYRDYTATILYLFTKKYLNISEFNKSITIRDGENKDFLSLMNHEKYVYDCIINTKKFNENQMSEFIIDDLLEKELIKKGKESKIGKLYNLIGITVIIISMIFSYKTKGISAIIGVALGLIIFVLKSIEKDTNILSDKGKKELKKIKALKNFIKDYTLIAEKDIEHIQILEEYIPYSLSLGMSPQVEEYIKQNEIYRNLIYKGREKWI